MTVRTETALIRVLCVDDHPVVRNGISQIVGLQPDMTVVAAAGRGDEAVVLYEQHRPDITLMDLQMPGMSGLEAIYAIRKLNAEARIIVLTMYRGDENIFRSLNAGAATYLLKDTVSHDLVRAIRDVHKGGSSIPADVASRLAMRQGHPILTDREVEVTELIAKGMRNKEIAVTLGIAEETVHAHVKNIFCKLHVNDRTAALSVALQRGIIHIDR